MIYSKLKNTISDNTYLHFEFNLFKDEELIGEYQLTIEEDILTLALFKINGKFRNQGFGKKSLEEITNNIYLLKSDYPFTSVNLDAKAFDNSPLENNDLVQFYMKYFDMSVIYADHKEILMSKPI